MVKPYHLHGTDLKTCAENYIEDLPNIFIFDCVWFDNAKSAVFIVGARLNKR